MSRRIQGCTLCIVQFPGRLSLGVEADVETSASLFTITGAFASLPVF